jgi:hypothetical protein
MPYPWSAGALLTASDLNAALASKLNVTKVMQPAGMILPFYIYPNNPWTDATVLQLCGLIRKYHMVPSLIILNPSSGPGTVADGNYAGAIKRFKAAGATVLGYVSTAYGGPLNPGQTTDITRTQAAVQADVSAWLSLYPSPPIDGIFFDEMPYDYGTSNVLVNLYIGYTNYCHGLGLRPVVGNPGTNEQSGWYDVGAADIIVTWETGIWPDPTGDLQVNLVGGKGDFSYTENAVLVYNQASLDLYKLRQLRRYVQYIYVTNDNMPNPWDTLPSYLEQLFAALADTQVPGRGFSDSAITMSGTVGSWDASVLAGARITITANSSINFPTGLITGQTYYLIVKPSGGSYSLSFASNYKGLTLSATTQTSLTTWYYDGTNLGLQGVVQY